jgi:hypothetical protein
MAHTFQAICDAWKADPSIFEIIPHHLIRDQTAREWNTLASACVRPAWRGSLHQHSVRVPTTEVEWKTTRGCRRSHVIISMRNCNSIMTIRLSEQAGQRFDVSEGARSTVTHKISHRHTIDEEVFLKLHCILFHQMK